MPNVKIAVRALVAEGGAMDTPEGVFWNVIDVEATGPPLRCDVELRAEIENGTYVVTEVKCVRRPRGPQVTGEVIRSVPVDRILQRGALKMNRLLATTRNDIADVRSQGPTDENLRLVARLYRMAYLLRDNPTSRVAQVLGLPYSTAARWVRQARTAGYLGPAESRKAGERTTRTRKGR